MKRDQLKIEVRCCKKGGKNCEKSVILSLTHHVSQQVVHNFGFGIGTTGTYLNLYNIHPSAFKKRNDILVILLGVAIKIKQ